MSRHTSFYAKLDIVPSDNEAESECLWIPHRHPRRWRVTPCCEGLRTVDFELNTFQAVFMAKGKQVEHQ